MTREERLKWMWGPVFQGFFLYFWLGPQIWRGIVGAQEVSETISAKRREEKNPETIVPASTLQLLSFLQTISSSPNPCSEWVLLPWMAEPLWGWTEKRLTGVSQDNSDLKQCILCKSFLIGNQKASFSALCFLSLSTSNPSMIPLALVLKVYPQLLSTPSAPLALLTISSLVLPSPSLPHLHPISSYSKRGLQEVNSSDAISCCKSSSGSFAPRMKSSSTMSYTVWPIW